MHGTPIFCPLTPKCWMLQKKPHDLWGTSEQVLQACYILIITLEKASITGSFASIVRQQKNNFFKCLSQFKLGKLNSQYQFCPQYINIVMHAYTRPHAHTDKYTYWFIYMCICICTLLYMYVYKYVFYIYVYTHIIVCVFRVSLLRTDLFLPGHILQKKKHYWAVGFILWHVPIFCIVRWNRPVPHIPHSFCGGDSTSSNCQELLERAQNPCCIWQHSSLQIAGIAIDS